MVANGQVRACCASEAAFALIERRDDLVVYQCQAPDAEGQPCGRKHYRVTLRGLDTRATAQPLGG